jgi:hypothetical protein
MWEFLKKLLGSNSPRRASFKGVDWLMVEGQWRTIESLSASRQQADNKQAIIQADTLIDSIMKQAMVPGSNFGDRLRSLKAQISPSVYSNLWQAHIKRNELVHETGSHVENWEKERYLGSFKNAMSHFRGIR